VGREIDEELEAHIAEAIEHGREPGEARRAFGSALRNREASRDIRLAPWLDSLRADAVFGWRQLVKKKVTSAAAILSLALAIGACTSAFRLIDALLLRPLPVAEPERLYAMCREGVDIDGQVRRGYDWAYPSFRLMRAAVKDEAELLAVSKAQRQDLTYRSDPEMEKAYLQYVSGWMFESFGLRPAAGRLFTESDDLKPGSHPYAVISYDYWKRRFAQDPAVVGRTFRMGDRLYEIVGGGPCAFHGHGDRNGHRYFRDNHDASRGNQIGLDLDGGAGAAEAGRGRGTCSPETARHFPGVRSGAGEGIPRHVPKGHRQIPRPEAAVGARRRGSVRNAAGLSPCAGGLGCAGSASAVDRVCECGQFDDGAGRVTRA